MSVYLMLATLTDHGRKTFQENPDMIKEINKEVEYDFVNIVEAPSDEVAAKLSIRLSAEGTMQTLTLAAIPVDDLIASLKKKSPSL